MWAEFASFYVGFPPFCLQFLFKNILSSLQKIKRFLNKLKCIDSVSNFWYCFSCEIKARLYIAALLYAYVRGTRALEENLHNLENGLHVVVVLDAATVFDDVNRGCEDSLSVLLPEV